MSLRKLLAVLRGRVEASGNLALQRSTAFGAASCLHLRQIGQKLVVGSLEEKTGCHFSWLIRIDGFLSFSAYLILIGGFLSFLTYSCGLVLISFPFWNFHFSDLVVTLFWIFLKSEILYLSGLYFDEIFSS